MVRLFPLGALRLRPNELVVLCVCADPEPNDTIRCFHPYRSVLKSDSDRPEPAHLLKMQRRMPGVGFQQFKSVISLFADRSRQGVVAGPKVWCGVMDQSGFDWPEV